MTNLSAEQRRFLDNAVQIAALDLTFSRLIEIFGTKPLSEVVDIHNGRGLRAADRDQAGDYDVYSAGGLIDKHSDFLSLEPFVVIGRKGSAGKPTFAPHGGWVIDTAYYAQPKDLMSVLPEYLFYAISYLDFSDDIITTAIPGINRTAIYKHEIPVPPILIQEACLTFFKAAETKDTKNLSPLPFPLDEQRRIVARIEELAARVEEARRLRQEAIEEADTLLRSKIDSLMFKDEEWSTLGSVASSKKGAVRSGPFGSQLHHSEFVESGVAAIGTRDVQTNHFELQSGWFVTPEKFENLRRYQVFPGDILVTIIGASIGRFCVVPSNIPLAFTTKHIVAVTLSQSRINSEFASYLLNYHSRSRDSIFSQTAGSAQPSLNQTKVRNIELPVPSLDYQIEIVEHLGLLERRIMNFKALQDATNAELDALLPSILDKAFKGEL